MGDGKGGGDLASVSDGDSPEKKRLKEYQCERELQYAELIKRVEKDPSAATAVKNLIFEASKYEARYETALEKVKDAEKDKEKAMEDKLVSDFMLGFRSTLYRMESIYSPKWLIKLDIRHSERWDIIFNLRRDHDDIKVFLNRMDDYHINEKIVCTNLDYFLENANIQHHEGDIPDIDDKIWPIVFKRLKIRNVDQQNSLKVLLQSIGKSEKDQVWKKQEKRKCLKSLVTLKGIPFDWMEKDLLNFVSDFSDSVEQHFLFQSKIDTTKCNGECIIIFNSMEAAANFIAKKDGFKFKDCILCGKVHPWRE